MFYFKIHNQIGSKSGHWGSNPSLRIAKLIWHKYKFKMLIWHWWFCSKVYLSNQGIIFVLYSQYTLKYF